MADNERPSSGALGFLTILSHEQLGFVGGYLITNLSGRPLEFHCTAPIKPNRAQQILYGPTLMPYLCGDQIGGALIAKGSVTPALVCTDIAAALAARELTQAPFVLLTSDASKIADEPRVDEATSTGTPTTIEASAKRQWRLDTAHSPTEHGTHFEWGRYRLATSARHARDEELARERLAGLGAFDLAEFPCRIRDAIEEAHRAARKADG